MSQCDLMGHPILKQNSFVPWKLAACKCNPYLTLTKVFLKKLFDTQKFDSYMTIEKKTKQERNINNSKHKTWMMSGILHTSWLGKVISGWDHIRKLNAFEERFFAWILLIEDAFLLFLWDNALKKLIIPLHFAECKPLIRTLNIILFSAHVLVSCDHTKTHRLLFYLFLILIDLDRLVHLKIFVFYHFYGHYFFWIYIYIYIYIYICICI